MPDDNDNLKDWAFLVNVANEQEAAIVESVLGAEKIPVLLKHKGAGGYLKIYIGMSNYGIDVYVPESALELAKGLLESEMMDMPEEAGKEEDIKAAEKYEKKRRGIVWIILAYLFLPLAIAVVVGIIIK